MIHSTENNGGVREGFISYFNTKLKKKKM